MGYMHIDNLYKPEAQTILLFRECYALEKIHGTSAHVRWNGSAVQYFAGGASHPSFVGLFDEDALAARFSESFGGNPAVVYGEAYGGKIQGMRDTYGSELRFVCFDVQVGELWLSVPQAESVAHSLGLEFVHYVQCSTDIDTLDAYRDAPSRQAKRNGILEDHHAEGVVLRPIIELRTNNGARVIAKHKRPEFSERASNPEVDPSKLAVLAAAKAIADEWVTEMRLTHVLDHLGNPSDVTATASVIAAMIEDVEREARGEIVTSRDARKAISTAAARMFKSRLASRLSDKCEG